jgi:ATP-dependent DNA ligase
MSVVQGDQLIYAGKVDHGFDKRSAADLRKRLTPLIRKTQPYSMRVAHKGIWNCSPKSNIAPSRLRERCVIHSFVACARIHERSAARV